MKVHARTIGKITELVISEATEEEAIQGDVRVDDGKVVISTRGTTVFELPLPGPIECYKDGDAEIQEWPEDDGAPLASMPIPFYEVAINPVIPLPAIIRANTALGGGRDNIRTHLMELAKVQLLDAEDREDFEAMLNMDWGVRVYRTFCRVLPADDQPRPDEVEEHGDEVQVIREGHNGLIGCVAYHHVGFVAGLNAQEQEDEGVPEQGVS